MDTGQTKLSWLGGKFILSYPKKEKLDLLEYSSILRSYSKTYIDKEVVTKTYYDTADLFFNQNGINITIIVTKGKSTSNLVIRYDSEKERISYLQYMPDTYELEIDAKSGIYNHLNFIARAISELITNGLEVNMVDVVKTIKPIVVVKKKREKYRVSGMNQLRLYFYFDKCEYTSTLKKGNQKMDLLEIVCENDPKEFCELYNKTIKDLVIENPTIVQTKHSDLLIGLDALVNINKI